MCRIYDQHLTHDYSGARKTFCVYLIVKNGVGPERSADYYCTTCEHVDGVMQDFTKTEFGFNEKIGQSPFCQVPYFSIWAHIQALLQFENLMKGIDVIQFSP